MKFLKGLGIVAICHSLITASAVAVDYKAELDLNSDNCIDLTDVNLAVDAFSGSDEDPVALRLVVDTSQAVGFCKELKSDLNRDGCVDGLDSQILMTDGIPDLNGDGIGTYGDLEIFNAEFNQCARLLGDVNLDSCVNNRDAKIINSNWNREGDVTYKDGDLNEDGLVSFGDLGPLNAGFGVCKLSRSDFTRAKSSKLRSRTKRARRR